MEAVRSASELCASAQGRLAAGDTLTKGDASPVTEADEIARCHAADLAFGHGKHRLHQIARGAVHAAVWPVLGPGKG